MNRKFERQFELKNCLDGKCKQWADEVIKGIENQELMVFDTKDEIRFCDVYRYGEIDKFIKENAKEKINIIEYLPLACQCIRFIDEDTDIELKKDKEKYFASYWSNTKRTILPTPPVEPLGPSAFIGEIILHDTIESGLSPYTNVSEAPFKGIMAHELIHAFDEMRLIVPAFRDWKNFWEKTLKKGSQCQHARQLMTRMKNNIDCYGSNKELKELKKYWSSQAEGWFNTLQKLKKKNDENKNV